MSDRKPELFELKYLENSNGTLSVQIIDRVQGRWQTLIGFFCLPPHTKEAILGMRNFSPENACMEVFKRWLDGGDERLPPKDWNTVIKVLNRMGNASLAVEVQSILTESRGESYFCTDTQCAHSSQYSAV